MRSRPRRSAEDRPTARLAPAARRDGLLGITISCVLVISACDSSTGDGLETTPSSSSSSSSGASTAPATATVGTSVVPVVAVYESVEFYPACGNEVLSFEGTTWYPIPEGRSGASNPEIRDRFDDVTSVERESWTPPGPQGLMRVAPPQPGDDMGTMAVWADGVARWVSDSERLGVWLVDDELTYTWEC